jgi:hypothetical protein
MADFIDPMDAVINQLQPRDTRPEVQQIDPQPQAQDPKPAEPTQPAEPVQPSQPSPQEPSKEPDPNFDIEKEIDELLELVKKEPVKEPEIKQDVNTVQEKKVIKVPKFLETPDNQQLSVDEMEEITNYIYDLEEQLANIEFDRKREVVEKSQLEQMLEKERAKSNEVFDKLKELEREMKKAKASNFPEELQTLIDYFKLNKENPTLYNKRNLVWETSKIIEQITEKPMDPYLLDRLKSGSYFNAESGWSSMDMPKAEPAKKDEWYNILQF